MCNVWCVPVMCALRRSSLRPPSVNRPPATAVRRLASYPDEAAKEVYNTASSQRQNCWFLSDKWEVASVKIVIDPQYNSGVNGLIFNFQCLKHMNTSYLCAVVWLLMFNILLFSLTVKPKWEMRMQLWIYDRVASLVSTDYSSHFTRVLIPLLVDFSKFNLEEENICSPLHLLASPEFSPKTEWAFWSGLGI